ncbi:zinc knuckle CX2CX4HX4C containing protein [Tanacetum coccineum]
MEVKEAVYVEEQDENRNEEAKRAKVNDVEVPAMFNYGNSGNPGKNYVNNNIDNVSNSGANEWENTNVQGMKSSENFDASHSNIKDMEMNKNTTVRKPLSFASVIQGLANSGNNKLKYVLVIVNEIGNKVVDMDPIVEEGSGLYFFNLNSEERLMNVIEKGPWLVDQKPLFVKIFNIPLEAWNVEGISRIASRLGNPIIMDKTDGINDIIKVDADNALIESIEIYYKNLGKSMMLDVEYAWRPPSCSHYKVFGHCFENFKIRIRTEEKIIKMNEKKSVNEKEETSNNGKQQNRMYGYNYGRGGFSYRGGMSSRGGYYGNGVVNENKGSEEEFMVVNNDNKRNAKMKGKMSDGLKKNVETTNRFASLYEVIKEDNKTEWQRLC